MMCVLYQAALFYIPRKIWKTCEGGLIASFGKIFQQMTSIKYLSKGRDAKRLVILKGDFESGEEKGGGQMKEEIARKYSAYFQSILHHNNGYFLTASASLSYSEAMQWKTKAQRIDCSSSK